MIPFKNTKCCYVDEKQMNDIYERLKTPYKYGVVLSFPEDKCDSPTVYRYDGKWYMSFIKISNKTTDSGYDSHLASSDDLIHWDYVCNTMQRNDSQMWDSKQIALYAGFVDNALYGEYTINPVNGFYHYAYLGGKLDGYETDPLTIGQCRTADPLDPKMYEKFNGPRLMPTDNDVRPGETLTLYKSNLFMDPVLSTGYPYVNAYNAKGPDHKESIFLAVSQDGENWKRYGDRAILADDTHDQRKQILGDPQILKLGHIYIMLYFVYENGITYNTFACSYDLVHWTRWNGEPLIRSSENYDELYAHKPCIVVENGIVYHYYCAVSKNNDRTIALATSQKI